MEESASLPTVIHELLNKQENEVKKLHTGLHVGTVSGSTLLIDGLDVPIPTSDVSFLEYWDEERNRWTSPNYNGKRVLIAPTGSSNYVVIGVIR